MNTLSIVRPGAGFGPFHDAASNSLLTYNGEVYNYRELASRWGIDLAADETDGHFVLRALLRFGPQCVTEFSGMFAFAFYDGDTDRLALCTDRFGEKPLYYTADDTQIYFASEVKALTAVLALEADPPIEWMTVEAFLGSDTPHTEVRRVRQGSWIEFSLREASVIEHLYWRLSETKVNVDPSDRAGAAAEFRVRLDRATQIQRPTVPFALMLSGGLDSAVLAHLMRPDLLVTVRYPGVESLDEVDKARRVAERLDIPLDVVEPTVDHFRRHAGELVEALDYPHGNASTFSEFMLYKHVAEKGLRVVVGGLGPDELLLGYIRHMIFLDGPDVTENHDFAAYRPLAQKVREWSPETSSAGVYSDLIVRAPSHTTLIRDTVQECFDTAGDVGKALTLVDLAVSFPGQVLTSDKLSSYFGLERRSPYLDHVLVEFCYGLPLDMKRPVAGVTKSLLRAAAEDIGVPTDITADRRKLGFSSPVTRWLADGELADWTSHHLSAVERDIGTPESVRRLIRMGQRPSSDPHSRGRSHALLVALWWQAAAAARSYRNAEGGRANVRTQ
jgi:asparagine synthase (glutamine-hydrolysing)